MKALRIIALSAAIMALAGCQSGYELNYNTVSQIQKGVTTEQQIRSTFGEPVAVHTDANKGTRILTYRYNNNDQIKKAGAGLLGAVAGGLLGNQVGGGGGRALMTAGGAVAGGALAGNAVTARERTQTLTVVISLATGRVVNYYYNEDQSRTQSWRPSTGPGRL